MPSRREELLRKWKLRGWTGMLSGETGELIELQAEDIKALLADIGRVSKIRQELQRDILWLLKYSKVPLTPGRNYRLEDEEEALRKRAAEFATQAEKGT